MVVGGTSVDKELEDVASLATEAGPNRQHALDEPTAPLAARAAADLAVQHGMAQLALRSVVRGFDALDPGKGPQAGLTAQDGVAHAGGLFV